MENSPEAQTLNDLAALLKKMRSEKPNDRGRKDRAWAVAITETEKLYAYWLTHVVGKGA
jgi:hypothetical protein